MKFTLGFSPCPNDTYIFDALVNKKIETNDFEFDVVTDDVDTLNEKAFEGKLDITKLSFPAFFENSDKYILLNAGAALGKGVGPLLITSHENKNSVSQNLRVALPGKNTTANLLFSFAYPELKNKSFIRFDKIEDHVKADAGVIIHENRFTYQDKGLIKITDLGEYWEKKMLLPIPLGGIAIRRSVDKKTSEQINTLIRSSIEYANAQYPVISEYTKSLSSEMNEKVMRQHIELYVNNYSLDLGEDGKKAIEVLYKTFLSNPGDSNYQSSGQLFLL